MGRLSITIRTDNAAFEELGRSEQIARILEHLARLYREDRPRTGSLRDVNGNTVGTYTDDV